LYEEVKFICILHRVVNQDHTVTQLKSKMAHQSITNNAWINQIPSNPYVWFDTDIGNDIDDVLSLLECLSLYGKDKLLGVSTTWYRPDQKGRIARVILNELGCSSIPVYPGIGIYDPDKEGDHLLKTRYGPYPVARFHKPWTKESLSAKEATAYRKLFPNFDKITLTNNSALEPMMKAIEAKKNDLVVLGLGFTSNIAAVMDAIVKNKVNRIVLMGGWFEDEKGAIKRIGYNTIGDLQASKKIFEQKDVPVLIANSDLCKQFTITKAEYSAVQEKAKQADSPMLVKAIAEDMKVWMEGKNQVGAEDVIHIADPLAVWMAFHPECINEVIPVELEVGGYVDGVDMFHADSKNYLKVKKVEKSNILVVKSLKEPMKVRDQLVEVILKNLR